MGRSKDEEFWNHVETIGGGLKCKFCQRTFKGKPSISRIKSHLSGLPGRDIQPCQRVSDDVKTAALEAIQGTNKRRKIMPSSSIDQMRHPISPSSLQQQVNNEVRYELPHEEGMEYRAELQNHTHHDSVQVNNEVGDQVTDEEWRQMDILGMVELMRNGRASHGEDVPNHQNGSEKSVQLVKAKGRKLLTKELIGRESKMSEIWDLLMDDKVSMISIYGIVGVGKTELAKHINNKLVETPTTSNCAYWVTASPDFSISKLQNSIARAADVELSSDDDENIKAAKLEEALTKNGNSVLILDDVWDYIPLDKVGIPVGVNLVLTTSCLDVYWKMRCQKNVKVEPLYQEEAWGLFLKELGDEIVLDPEIERIAKSIVSECEGLPLGIEVMARNLRGVRDIREWRNALANLNGAVCSRENRELFQKLRRSYDYLNDSALQQCFLYCALFGSSVYAKRTIIDYLIVEGIIKGKKCRRQQLDEGYTMLNRLENVCLISFYVNCFKMHSLIWHMAVQIMEESSWAVIKGSEKEFSDEENWTEDLVRVSLVDTYFEEIPSNLSPCCPNLLTLLLRGTWSLERTADSFFKHMRSLNVLDLSYSYISELPSSVSHLVSLGALLLRGCKNLRQVPSLAELRRLKELNLHRSGIEELPQGMELLSNLRYLDVFGTEVKELPQGILPKLCRLQVLYVDVTVEAEEIACLRKLEALRCCFHNADEFNKWTTSLGGCQLVEYEYVVGQYERQEEDEEEEEEVGDENKVVFKDCSISREDAALFLPGNIECLVIKDCHVRRRFMFERATKLRRFIVENCDGIEYFLLFFLPHVLSVLPLSPPNSGTFSHLAFIEITECASLKKLFPCWMLSNLQNLEEIRVENCENIEEIVVMEETQNYDDDDVGSLCLPKLRLFELEGLPKLKSICNCKLICNSLESLIVIECASLKKLFPCWMQSNVQKLEEIRVEDCENIEEIIVMEETQNYDDDDVGSLCLPKLRLFELEGLPKLKSICSCKLICNSLESLTVIECASLKKLFPCWMLSNLQNLEVIRVEDCENIEEIIVMEETQNYDDDDVGSLCLPKLRLFELEGLPELKSICNCKLICNSLESLTVIKCASLKKLFPCWMLSNLQNLEVIRVENCENIEEIIVMEETQNYDDDDVGSLCLPKLRLFELEGLLELKSICNCKLICNSLKYLTVIKCASLKKLFPCWMLSNLQNLEEIRVEDCENIEEIIVMEETQNYDDDDVGSLCLPKLRLFELEGLPELKSICSCKLICNSLESRRVIKCASLKKLFPCLMLSNLQNLEVIRVENCENIEEIIVMEETQNYDDDDVGSLCLPKLRLFELEGLPKLKSICSCKLICNSLESLTVIECASLKKLFPCWMLSNLQNLEVIRVEDCENIEEIIVMEETQNYDDDDVGSLCLPKLRLFELEGLPELKSICSCKLICNSLESLRAIKCASLKKLFPYWMLSNLQNLEVIRVENCENIEEIIVMEETQNNDDDDVGSLCLPKLRLFELEGLPKLKSICSCKLICNSLKYLTVIKCASLKKLFPCWMLLNLQNLEVIRVEDCENIEEIIVMEETQNYDDDDVGSLCLPKLRLFELKGLLELKSICSCKLICNSLQYLKVIDCIKVEWMPFSLLDDHHSSPIPSLYEIVIKPKEWSERLSWAHPNTYTVLSTFKRIMSL